MKWKDVMYIMEGWKEKMDGCYLILWPHINKWFVRTIYVCMHLLCVS